MKKRTLAILLCLALTAGLAACSNESADADESQSPSQDVSTQTDSGSDVQTTDSAVTEPVAEAVLKVNTGAVSGEILYRMFECFGEKLEEVSGGAMTIDLFSSSDYRDSVALDDVLNDNVDIVYLSSASASTTVTDLAYMSIMGTYAYVGGYDDTESFLTFYEATKDEISEVFADYNMHFLSYRVPGYLVIASNGVQAVAPSDLSGKIMRVSGTWPGRLVEAMGIPTATVKITEIATALQRGTVDAALSGDEQCRDLMFYEVSDYITVFPEADQVGSIVMCQSRWDALDEAQQACVEEAAYYAMVDMLANRATEYEECLKIFEDGGSEVLMLTAEESAVWTDYLETVYEEMDTTVSEKGIALKEAILEWRSENGLD